MLAGSYIFVMADRDHREMQKTRLAILTSLLSFQRIFPLDLYSTDLLFAFLLDYRHKKWNSGQFHSFDCSACMDCSLPYHSAGFLQSSSDRK
jgi:hypothetical protein